jgi:HSP20 family protein
MSLFNTLIPSFTRSTETAGTTTQTVRPRYDVQQTAEAYNVTAYLPGVAKDGLEVTAEGNEIRITGRRAWQQPEGWTPLYRETAGAAYELTLTHDNAIDAEKISAELTDGVLRVTLPKAEAVKPRKIAVN